MPAFVEKWDWREGCAFDAISRLHRWSPESRRLMKNCWIAGRNGVPITKQQERAVFNTGVKRRLGQAARWLKYRVASRALILMYHRVTDLPNDPYLLAVKPKRFAEQMEVIRRHCIPMRLQEMVDA